MTFTYGYDPSASDVAAVRFEIQDTNPNAPFLQDEEIKWAIFEETGTTASDTKVTLTQPFLWSSAAHCMEAIARSFAMQADTELGTLSITYSKQADQYNTRAKELRLKAQGMQSPVFTAQTRSQKQTYRDDSDAIRPKFTRDEFSGPYDGQIRSGGLPPMSD